MAGKKKTTTQNIADSLGDSMNEIYKDTANKEATIENITTKPEKAEAFKKPNKDYYRLDLVKRKTVNRTMTKAIEKDYRGYLDKVRGNKSVTAYIHELIEADMEQNKTKTKPTQQDKLIEAIKKMDSKQLKAIQGMVEVMGLL